MKKILWSLFVVLVLLVATGASADIRSDKGNTYSNDLGISSALDNYSECPTNVSLLDKDVNSPYNVLVAKLPCKPANPYRNGMRKPPAGKGNNDRNGMRRGR